MKAPHLLLHAVERNTSGDFLYRGTWPSGDDVEHSCEWWISETQSMEFDDAQVATMGYQRVVDNYIKWLNKENS